MKKHWVLVVAFPLVLFGCTSTPTDGGGGSGGSESGSGGAAGSGAGGEAGSGAGGSGGDGGSGAGGSGGGSGGSSGGGAGGSGDGGAGNCPDSPMDNTICATVEGVGTQVFVFPNPNVVLTGSTEDADPAEQDNITLTAPVDSEAEYDCSVADGTPEKPIITMNLGINAFANDDSTEAWVVTNFPEAATCAFDVTTAAAGSGDVYEGSFSATLVRVIGPNQTDPEQTLQMAGTFRGIRP